MPVGFIITYAAFAVVLAPRICRWLWKLWENEFPLGGSRREATGFGLLLALVWPVVAIGFMVSAVVGLLDRLIFRAEGAE